MKLNIIWKSNLFNTIHLFFPQGFKKWLLGIVIFEKVLSVLLYFSLLENSRIYMSFCELVL